MKKRNIFPHMGTFQPNHRFTSENPMEEMWSRISRYGTKDHIRNTLIPDKKDIDWDDHVNYSIARVRQAVEFRNSSKNMTLLTRPLGLYYSFLNLIRGFLALGPEIMPSSGHGLKFVHSDNLLDSGATITKGTFSDYLRTYGFKWKKDTVISLSEIFSRIIEIYVDFNLLEGCQSFVFPVAIKANSGTPIYIEPILPHKEFPNNWEKEFPSISSNGILEDDNKCFVINDKKVSESIQSISAYLCKILHYDLVYKPLGSPWYLIREVDGFFSLSRASYYFIGVFILGSIVRYEPEVLLKVNQLDSEIGWFISRFLDMAERFFPQLMLNDQFGSPVFF